MECVLEVDRKMKLIFYWLFYYFLELKNLLCVMRFINIDI